MHLGWSFLPWQSDEQSVCFGILLRVTFHSDAQAHVQTFQPKTDNDTNGASYGDVMMALGSRLITFTSV